jgi:hypothetical protein
LGFLSITLNEGVEHQTSLDWGDELYDGESNKLQSIGLQSGDTYQLPENWSADILGSQRPGNTPSHEVSQVLVYGLQSSLMVLWKSCTLSRHMHVI